MINRKDTLYLGDIAHVIEGQLVELRVKSNSDVKKVISIYVKIDADWAVFLKTDYIAQPILEIFSEDDHLVICLGCDEEDKS